jgi:Domain of unknown function (DUF4350)
MNDRLLTMFGAAAAFAICVALLVPTPSPEAPVSRPITSDRAGHGLHALFQWISRSGVRASILYRRYSTLNELAPGSGNLLIITLPQRIPSREDERESLADWVAAGNTALVMVGNVTAPDWATANGSANADGDSKLAATLEFDFAQAPAPKDASNSSVAGLKAALQTRPNTSRLVPVGKHALLTGVDQVSTDRAAVFGRALQVTGHKKARVLPALLRGEAARAEDLWTGRVGAGRVMVLADPAIFANAHLGEMDNARLFNNLVTLVRSNQGVVVFDDMHQGVSDLYDPQAFARDPRVYFSLLFLLGLWLAWITGHSNRFGPVGSDAQTQVKISYARAVGGLLARQSTPRAAASALIAAFLRDCGRRHPALFERGLDGARLAALPGMPATALAGLAVAQQALAAGRCPDLIKLTNDLRTLRMRL